MKVALMTDMKQIHIFQSIIRLPNILFHLEVLDKIPIKIALVRIQLKILTFLNQEHLIKIKVEALPWMQLAISNQTKMARRLFLCYLLRKKLTYRSKIYEMKSFY